jgi:hypothetical protein
LSQTLTQSQIVTGASQICKNLDSPHPLTPSPMFGRGELELRLPSPKHGRGAGGEGKDLSTHWDAPIVTRLFTLRVGTCAKR